ncbi:MAG: helix-turn-helix domain-containing protein [Sedimentisphaerales bacterium]|nr:helix-turn-helix domain-containing protein [Sedimentisphaerales bacterium]
MPTEPDKQGLLFAVERPTPRAASYQSMRGMEPLSRNTDSLGSFKAGDRMAKSGLGGKRRARVYHALRQAQGSTSAELAKAAGLDRHDVARRLPELAKAGWVVRGRARMCKVCAVPCTTWYVVRRWIETTDRQSSVPAQRPTAAAKSEPGAKSPTSGGSSDHGQHGGPAAVPGSVTTPEDRRRLREKLAAEGDDRTRRFLEGVRR